jgi:hypothetical protein
MGRFEWRGEPPTPGALQRAFLVMIGVLDGRLDSDTLQECERALHKLLVESESWAKGRGQSLCDDYECAHAMIRDWIDRQKGATDGAD